MIENPTRPEPILKPGEAPQERYLRHIRNILGTALAIFVIGMLITVIVSVVSYNTISKDLNQLVSPSATATCDPTVQFC